MNKFNTIFPDFNFDEHKGYSTQKHKNSLKEFPPLIIHRQSFLHKISTVDDYDELDEQQSLFVSDISHFFLFLGLYTHYNG